MLAYSLAQAKQTCANENCFKILDFEQKRLRIDVAQEVLTTFNDGLDLLKKVIAGDGPWVYGYDIKTKAQS